jgi:mono/diheme cytochrome c family protein
MSVCARKVCAAIGCAHPAAVLLAAFVSTAALPAMSKDDTAQIALGRYLAQVAGCGDCHTSGHVLGNPGTTRHLGGSEVEFEVPEAGIVDRPNLTPDIEPGLGSWTTGQIVDPVRTGITPQQSCIAAFMSQP